MSEIRRRTRWLLLHPESDCYFEVFREEEWAEALDTGECCDATDDPVHEQLFKLYQAQR